MIAWALEMMLSAALLMALVLAARGPISQLFGAEWAYALWLLPVVVPFLPLLPALEPAPAFMVLVPGVEAGVAPAEAASGAEWLLLALALWAGGAAFFAIWQQSTYSAFMLHLGPQGRTAVPSSYGGIKVIESEAVDGPVAVGVFRRRIVVPIDFGTRYSAAEQKLALEHELIHHRRFDLGWNWVALMMLALHWFNPIAHFAFRAFRADQELACDAAVTRRLPGHRHDYACALVKSASHPGLVAVCPLNRAEFLKQRLRMMKQHRASWARTLGGAASLAGIGAAGLLFATPGFAEAEPSQVVVAEAAAEPVIRPAELATLRVKCGRDEGATPGASIICSSEEASDPEVRAIMDRTMARVEHRVEEATRLAVDARKIHAQVAKSAAVEVTRHGEHAKLAVDAATRAGEAAGAFDSAAVNAAVAESLVRVRQQLAHLDGGKLSRELEKALKIEGKRYALVNVGKIREDALRSARVSLVHVRPRLSAQEIAEIRAEADESRREALREAGEEREEALREAAEERREAIREREREQRELAREMRELQRELRRELRHVPRPVVQIVPVTPVTPTTSVPPRSPRAPAPLAL